MTDSDSDADAHAHADRDGDATGDADGDGVGERVRAWMVERTYDDRNLVTVVYATPDGERYLQKELSGTMLSRTAITAAVDADPDRLVSVEADDTRERYATEATSVAAQYDPDDEV